MSSDTMITANMTPEPLPHHRARHIINLKQVTGISPQQQASLEPVTQRYAFRVTDYYLNLIDWSDPDDPIRQLVIPREEELEEWGRLDASDEAHITVAPGVQHKYQDTALLLCSSVCSCICRYCFRKRLFTKDNHEVESDVTVGIDYIAKHPDINNVLLTGGDPLLLSPERLESILERLHQIDHVRVIRIGSKVPAFDPHRILADAHLQQVLRRYSLPERRLYLMAHFDHPRELTAAAQDCLSSFLANGVICVNQCPLIRGVNDNADVLAELYSRLSFIGCPPYYLLQCRPTAGNKPFTVPLVRGWHLFQEALRHGSGLARRARYLMSHATGKIEILFIDEERIYLRYHEAAASENIGRVFACRRDDAACWFDDLQLI